MNTFQNVRRFGWLLVAIIFVFLDPQSFLSNLKNKTPVNFITRRIKKRGLIREQCAEDSSDVVVKVKNKRILSIDLGHGKCKYTESQPLGKNHESDGILISSYPASGMRLTWQHVEGITGIEIGDDFDCHSNSENRVGIIKTQYPHFEGNWNWNDTIRDVILLVRNPRWAIPSYATLIAEIEYALNYTSIDIAEKYLFTERNKGEHWVKFRDYRIDEEMKLWRWHIDFWMNHGEKYWNDWDYERNGQFPFDWIPERRREKDWHCNQGKMQCHPKAVVSYENIRDVSKGPAEINKIAEVIEKNNGLTVIGDEARKCVFHKTLTHKTVPHNVNRTGDVSEYVLTLNQLNDIKKGLEQMETKYLSLYWSNNGVAKDLVKYLQEYRVSVQLEIQTHVDTSDGSVPKREQFSLSYNETLKDWYDGTGKGDRYNKEKVMEMPGFWAANKHLYNE